jgi:hypothetical protein
MIQCFFFFQFSRVASKVRISQEELAKSSYKATRKIENLEMLLHVDEPLEPKS